MSVKQLIKRGKFVSAAIVMVNKVKLKTSSSNEEPEESVSEEEFLIITQGVLEALDAGQQHLFEESSVRRQNDGRIETTNTASPRQDTGNKRLDGR